MFWGMMMIPMTLKLFKNIRISSYGWRKPQHPHQKLWQLLLSRPRSRIHPCQQSAYARKIRVPRPKKYLNYFRDYVEPTLQSYIVGSLLHYMFGISKKPAPLPAQVFATSWPGSEPLLQPRSNGFLPISAFLRSGRVRQRMGQTMFGKYSLGKYVGITHPNIVGMQSQGAHTFKNMRAKKS